MTVLLFRCTFACACTQHALFSVEMHAAVRLDGWNRVRLYAEESYLMDWETRLCPVCGYQHYYLQWLLLHTGDNAHILFLWKLFIWTFCMWCKREGVFRKKCEIKWCGHGDAHVNTTFMNYPVARVPWEVMANILQWYIFIQHLTSSKTLIFQYVDKNENHIFVGSGYIELHT